jgi:hypothetical protein
VDDVAICFEHIDLLDCLDRLHVELLECGLELLVVDTGSLRLALYLPSGRTFPAKTSKSVLCIRVSKVSIISQV